jgi:hypothetical protein
MHMHVYKSLPALWDVNQIKGIQQAPEKKKDVTNTDSKQRGRN